MTDLVVCTLRLDTCLFELLTVEGILSLTFPSASKLSRDVGS